MVLSRVFGRYTNLEFDMKFRMTHNVFGSVKEFDENTAPDWLTSKNTVKGSTMDYRWFWKDCVLTLPVGGKTQTDFRDIERIE